MFSKGKKKLIEALKRSAITIWAKYWEIIVAVVIGYVIAKMVTRFVA